MNVILAYIPLFIGIVLGTISLLALVYPPVRSKPNASYRAIAGVLTALFLIAVSIGIQEFYFW